MTILTVGAGQQFSTLKAAVAASTDGDVLLIQPGTYLNDFATINAAITLKGVGGMVHMKAEASPSDGKAIFTVNDDVTFENFEFSGAAVPDQNGAGIRHQGGDLTVLNSYFHDNQTGILTNNGTDLTVTIRNSEFANNGIGDGYTHNIYANRIGRLEIDNSYFHDIAIGHHIKSRAAETIVTSSVIADYDSSSSYSIDLPNGGKATISSNFIHNGPNSDNFAMVSFGVEGNLHAASSLTMQDNTAVNDVRWGAMLWNTTGISADISDTSVWGMTASQLVNGLAEIAGTDILGARPAVDGSSPWRGVVSVPPAVVDVVDEIIDLVDMFGDPVVAPVLNTPVVEVPEVTEPPETTPGTPPVVVVEEPEVTPETLPVVIIEEPEAPPGPTPGTSPVVVVEAPEITPPGNAPVAEAPEVVEEPEVVGAPQPGTLNSSHWEWLLSHSSGNHSGWWNGMGNGRPHNFTRASETDNTNTTTTTTSDDWVL
jgi:hypothetical protein